MRRGELLALRKEDVDLAAEWPMPPLEVVDNVSVGEQPAPHTSLKRLVARPSDRFPLLLARFGWLRIRGPVRLPLP